MSAPVTADEVVLLTGWALAAAGAAAAAVLRVRLGRVRGIVARAAHEIRGPLCAARLALDACADARGLAAVDLELRRAGLAVDDLDAAPNGRPAPARADAVDLAEVVTAAAEGWRALAAAHGAELDVVAPPGAWLRGDRLRLAQAIANLVANAAEHGAGPVRIGVRSAGGVVVASVEDRGPGLPAPVERLVAREGRGPRGHGLAVAAAVADAHGGELVHAPAVGGTRLALRLPVTGSAGAARARGRMRPVRSGGAPVGDRAVAGPAGDGLSPRWLRVAPPPAPAQETRR